LELVVAPLLQLEDVVCTHVTNVSHHWGQAGCNGVTNMSRWMQ
jgi:hypothetical protein